jgi:hypothetical protein
MEKETITKTELQDIATAQMPSYETAKFIRILAQERADAMPDESEAPSDF